MVRGASALVRGSPFSLNAGKLLDGFKLLSVIATQWAPWMRWLPRPVRWVVLIAIIAGLRVPGEWAPVERFFRDHLTWFAAAIAALGSGIIVIGLGPRRWLQKEQRKAGRDWRLLTRLMAWLPEPAARAVYVLGGALMVGLGVTVLLR